MKRVWGMAASALVLSFVISAAAQDQRPPAPVPPPDAPKPTTNDPRVGLKPGMRDAGQAARNMELLSSLPKPEGFSDSDAPAAPAPAPAPEPTAQAGPRRRPPRGRSAAA